MVRLVMAHHSPEVWGSKMWDEVKPMAPSPRNLLKFFT